MKTRDQQELEEILKQTKANIAVMLVKVQRNNYEEVRTLKAQLAILNAELVGQAKVFKLLEQMAGVSNLALHMQHQVRQ